MNNLENPGQNILSPEENEKKNENKVRLLLEQMIDDLGKKPQTPENIAETMKYQEKLAEHMRMLDEKYAVAQEEADPFSAALRGTGEMAESDRMDARKRAA